MKLLFCFLLALPVCSLAQFGPKQLISIDVPGPYASAIGDIDNDTFIDIIVGSGTSGGIYWFKNTSGSGNFTISPMISSEIIRNITLVDVDGDDDLDIITSFSAKDEFAWFENLDGQGTFSVAKIIDVDAFLAYEALGADLDGDDDIDILGAMSDGQSAVWYENLDGQGTFGPRQYISQQLLDCRSVFAADIDGDTDLDVVANSSGDVTISWFENIDGEGTFGTQQIIAPETSPTYTSDIFVADLDGDTDLDVLGTKNSISTIEWYENIDGNGTFSAKQIITSEAVVVDTVFAIDLDNDDDHDILYKSNPSFTEAIGEVAWSENLDGQGTFGPKQVIDNTFFVTRDVRTTDLDNDGDQDIIALSSRDNSIYWFENRTILNHEEVLQRDIILYPIPTGDVLYTENHQRIQQLLFYNALGQQVLSVQAPEGSVSVGSLAKGLYFVEVHTAKGSVIKKMVKE